MAKNQIEKDLIVEERDAKVARMYLEGKRQIDIAHELGIAKNQVTYSLDRLRTKWRESQLIDTTEMFVRTLEKIDNLERTYWEAWEASKKSKKVTGIKKSSISENQVVDVRSEERSEGNPKFLEGVMACIRERIKLFGLETVHIDLTSNGNSLGLNPDETASRVAQLLEVAQKRKEAKAMVVEMIESSIISSEE